MRKLLLLAGCLIGAALLFAACGSSESDEEKIIDVIESSATSDDPADCKALNTVAFMEQTEFEEGQDAVKSCEEDAEDTSNDPDKVTVSKVKIDGSNATANVALVGGTFDGQTVEVGVVQEDGDWKVDGFESFIVFDRAPLLEGFEEAFEEEAQGNEEEAAASCVLEGLQAASNEELEEAILTPESFVELVGGCFE